MNHHTRLHRIAALAVTVAAFAAPVASAQQDLRSPDARDAATAATVAGGATDPTPAQLARARAQERYYSSYGESAPLIPSPQPASPDGGIGWLPVALLATAGALVVAGGSWGRRRVRVRRRVLA
jgi:hypothetical protein